MGKEKNVKKKKKTVYQKTYSQQNVLCALNAIEKGMSTWQATKIFQIPRSTLYTKYKKIVPIECAKGPATYLTNEEETIIVNWLLYCCERGFPISKSQLLDCVQKLVVELKRETSFKDNRPGRHWYESFCRRHVEITERVAQNLTASRASATETVLRNWFSEVKEHLQKLNLVDIHPSRVYNLDESAFFLVPKADKVLARKGCKSVYKVVNGNEKESLTVLFTVNGAGIMLPPMILFWYERIPASVMNKLPPGWIAGTTEKGWMTGESFFNYITTQFYPWLVKNHIEFPVILYVDGHASHLTIPLSQFCKQHQIELIALYPNATHILQPLDVAVFHALKLKWKKAVDYWRQNNGSQRMKRETFASILQQALDSMPNLSSTIQHGFKTCGLSPFNVDSVDFNVLNKKQKNSEQTKEPATNTSPEDSNSKEEARKHLEYFENNLCSGDLEDFRCALSNGTLEVSDSDNKGLFRYWIKMKKLAGEEITNIVSVDFNDSVVERNEDSIDVLEPTFCFSSNSSGVVNIDNLDIIIVPENNTFDSRQTDIDLSVMSDIAASSNLNQNIALSCIDSVETRMDSSDGLLSANTDNNNKPVFNLIDLNVSYKVGDGIIIDTTTLKNSLQDTENSIDQNKDVITEESLESIKIGNETRESEQTLHQVPNKIREVETESAVIDLSLNIINKDPENSSAHEMQLNIENMKKKSEDSRKQLPSNILLRDISNISRKQSSKKADEPESFTDKENKEKNTIPSPFKKSLVWPSKILSNKKTKSIKKVSTVLTSEEWQNQQLQIQEEKLRKQREIEERKKLRAETKFKKDQEKESRKVAAEKRKTITMEIKRLMEEKKNLI